MPAMDAIIKTSHQRKFTSKTIQEAQSTNGAVAKHKRTSIKEILVIEKNKNIDSPINQN